MAIYMAGRIIDGAQDYSFVINKRADLKEGIDVSLMERGREDLIVA